MNNLKNEMDVGIIQEPGRMPAPEVMKERQMHMQMQQMQASASPSPNPPPPTPPNYNNFILKYNNNNDSTAKIAAEWWAKQILNEAKKRKIQNTNNKANIYSNLSYSLITEKNIKNFKSALEKLIIKKLQKEKIVILTPDFEDDLLKEAAENNNIPYQLIDKNKAVFVTNKTVEVSENIFEKKSFKIIYDNSNENGLM